MRLAEEFVAHRVRFGLAIAEQRRLARLARKTPCRKAREVRSKGVKQRARVDKPLVVTLQTEKENNVNQNQIRITAAAVCTFAPVLMT